MARQFVFCVLLISVFVGDKGVLGETIVYYDLDGIYSSTVESSLLDGTGSYTATHIAGASGAVYDDANPIYNASGTSAYFSGDNCLLIPDEGVGSELDFTPLDEFTIECFVYPQGSATRRIFSKYINCYMYLDSSNNLYAGRKWGAGAWLANTTHLSGPNLPSDQWSHAALVWDSDAVDDKLKLYVNGVLATSAAGTSTATYDSTADFVIAGYRREDDSFDQYFTGKYDEFRISDTALLQSELLYFGSDANAVVQFAATESRASINEGPVEIEVRLNREVGEQVSVDLAVVGGTAVKGVDYNMTEPITLLFEPNETVTTVEIELIVNPEIVNKTIILGLSNAVNADAGAIDTHTVTVDNSFANSLGMEMKHVAAGTFMMGESVNPIAYSARSNLTYPTRSELIGMYPNGDPENFVISEDHTIDGDYDEQPVHEVTLTYSFYFGEKEVTNSQYKLFDPSHPINDDEPVVNISWEDANGFCEWLSSQEGQVYRLPAEAEWEYSCRAGTTSIFYGGDSPSSGPNPWGLYDMHGSVEEWCWDWYGIYDGNSQVDPVGPVDGDFKVTRGGDSTAHAYFKRSANRASGLMQMENPYVGFRVVMGVLPETEPLALGEPPLNQRNIIQEVPPDINAAPSGAYFFGPKEYVRIPRDSYGPVYWHHNHVPGITYCANGDLLAIWYSCIYERGRELAVAASRLRWGSDEWEAASLFWDTADRNDHCPSIWTAQDGTIYHFNGMAAGYGYSTNAIIMRTSQDNGATWSKGRIIQPDYVHQLPGEPVFRASDGSIMFGADVGGGDTGLFRSQDGGLTWTKQGGAAKGIHAGVAQLSDGSLLAFGRGSNIDGKSPKSVSVDMGENWSYSASVFPTISGGQRSVLLKLANGNLFFASPGPDGLFGALSYDEGATWPKQRIITNVTDAGGEHGINTFDDGRIRMSSDSSEPQGYLSVCQSPNGVIHLISTNLYYAFNQEWLEETPPPGFAVQTKTLPVKNILGKRYDCNAVPTESDEQWMFVGDGSQSTFVSIYNSGVVQIQAGAGEEPRWSNERINEFVDAPVENGLTVETKCRVLSSSSSSAGFELEAIVRCGTLRILSYALTVSPDRVYFNGDLMASGLDNSSDFHRFRISVREDSNVQIYRDFELLGTVRMDSTGTGWRPPTRGNYLEFGINADAANVLVDSISYDYSGGYESVELTADFDESLKVDGNDLGVLCDQWLDTVVIGATGDLFADGIINFRDAAILGRQWLESTP